MSNATITALTDEQLHNNKKEYCALLSELCIDYTDIMKLLEDINFFNAPCTSTDFKAYEGGLCEYALELFNELYQLANAYFPGKYTRQDCIKVALFKDIYKAELYEPYMKNVKNEISGQWEQIKAFRTKETRLCYGDTGFSSYMMIKYFIELNDEQIEAICNSTFRDKEAYVPDLIRVRRTFKLMTLVGMADIVVYYLN